MVKLLNVIMAFWNDDKIFDNYLHQTN